MLLNRVAQGSVNVVDEIPDSTIECTTCYASTSNMKKAIGIYGSFLDSSLYLVSNNVEFRIVETRMFNGITHDVDQLTRVPDDRLGLGIS